MLELGLIIGLFAVLYIAGVAYQRAKAPRNGERKIKAQVESVYKLRVPVQAIGERQRVAHHNTVMPASVYQMVFRDKDTEEMYSFSVKADVAERVKEKDSGLLTFNGDRFIGFQKG